ncbi:MAG: TVP38/TMEM64 family protein [Pseudomonadota bacterium]
MKNTKKIAVVLVLALPAVLFFAFDLQRFFTLSFIKESQAGFQSLYREWPLLVPGAFFLIYILVVAVNIPGAAVMSLAAGGLFGFRLGLLIVSFASSIGAALACFLARYVFRDLVRKKFGDRLKKVNDGVLREGAFYLFSLRLIPAIPFFVVNLVMGLTSMPLRTFYWVSQLGMLPGTMVFVNAGKELGRVESLSAILSPGLIISFVILGLFPLAAQKTISFLRGRAGKKA